MRPITVNYALLCSICCTLEQVIIISEVGAPISYSPSAILRSPWSVMVTNGSLPSENPKPSNVPPGMVMGKPCKICTAFRNWKPGSTEPDSTKRRKQQSAVGVLPFPVVAASLSSSSAASPHDAPATRPEEPPPGCPPDVEQLGRATWTFLHTTAAYYPDKPTPAQRANMLMLLRSLPVLYPCGWCAKDFGGDITANPPNVSSRSALSLWLCERHNSVITKLGKERFDCTKVDERWKDGSPDGRCD